MQSVDYRDYQSLFFDPHFLTISPGDSIAFTVTNFDHQPQSVFVPDGARHWQAETGENITVQFEEEGVYIFDCHYHNVMGMAGVILVGSPGNVEAARQFFVTYREETFAFNKARLDYLWDAASPLVSSPQGAPD
jgi:pseudoazurin